VSLDDYPVELDDVYHCWTWTAKLGRDGYGIQWRDGRCQLAHRMVYEAEVGAIDAGLVLDHLCRNRACCAPYHLEPVTRRENERRKVWGYRVKIKTCPKGHDLYEHGRRTPYGGRVCRTCSGLR
jgi:hypothetical protein